LTIDNEKLKVMVELYIGSFCEDLKKRVQSQPYTNNDQTNIHFNRDIANNNTKTKVPSLNMNKPKIIIEEPRSTAREMVDKLNTERNQYEQFELMNRNIKNNE